MDRRIKEYNYQYHIALNNLQLYYQSAVDLNLAPFHPIADKLTFAIKIGRVFT
ncbi:MAG: hypothetical protein GY821_14935 [Gammaproteobacteria bacterium]|nr:hypothetical protein [Gammaproteobacteria bacterium]